MDERPIKLLARAPAECQPDLQRLARQAGKLAEEAGADLSFDFGKEHIGFIVACNQFLRLWFRGEHAGLVELPPAAGANGEQALGQVFRMFGWTTLPCEQVTGKFVDAAFAAANAKGAPKL